MMVIANKHKKPLIFINMYQVTVVKYRVQEGYRDLGSEYESLFLHNIPL